ncbi:MAG TPA: hypothetical protein VHM89_03195 [Acidimicrobiales bacterium]|nr:hypothetical protein [Acidimicrobiales bacterium]
MLRRTLARRSLLVTVLAVLLGLSGLPISLVAGVSDAVRRAVSPAAADEEAPLRPGPAYWLVGSDGGVFAFGRAGFAGGTSDTPLRSSVAGMANTPTAEGYWLAARDGGVFAFGDAPFLGGASEVALNNPIVDIAATPSGQGYWLAGTDGGVFAFGDAAWLGGVAGAQLNSPVTAIVATPTGRGYWLAARDGGVFAFGDARWLGGAAGIDLTKPVVDMTPTPSGDGYWLVASDGGVFAFGDARFYGSALGMSTNRGVVGIAATPAGRGYWLASGDGGVFAFGDAGFYGAMADAHLGHPVVGMASGVGNARPEFGGAHLMSTFGWDVSWPQCGRPLPGGKHGYALVGVTDGHLWDINPCLAQQHRFSTRGGALGGLYVNVNWPSAAAEPAVAGQMADDCAVGDMSCQMYEWGRRGVLHAVDAATERGVSAPMWWLDVETANRWSGDKALNRRIVEGAIAALGDRGIGVGIYSTSYQWGVIVGDFAPALPNWLAGPNNVDEAAAACADGPAFGGGAVWMVQYPQQGFDGNLMCEAGAAAALASFKTPPPPPIPQLPAAPGRAVPLRGPQRAI